MESHARRPHLSDESRSPISGSPPLSILADAPAGTPPVGQSAPAAVAAGRDDAGEVDRLKAAVAQAQRLRGEFTTTIVSGLIGGVCISLFSMQPASATGAMLQEALHFVRDPTVVTDGGAMSRQMQVLTLLQFSVMLLSLGTGTAWGRAGRLRAAQTGSVLLHRLLHFIVPIASAIAVISLTICLYSNGRNLGGWQQTWICGLFALATGLLWGIMPEDNATTARSFLVKRAALGDLWAVRQIILFAFCVGFAVTLYQSIMATNASLHLIGTVVLGLGLIDTGYLASSIHLAAPLPQAPQTNSARWAPIVCPMLAAIFVFVCLGYIGRISETRTPEEVSAASSAHKAVKRSL
jgi:hypothetical protein